MSGKTRQSGLFLPQTGSVSSVGYLLILFFFSLLPGKVVEYDVPAKLLEDENSLFAKLVLEYWSHANHTGKASSL